MRSRRIMAFATCWALVHAFAVEACRAAVTFLGPTPYLSKADSPFPVDGSNPNFFLEDFEDGLFNTPGILLPSDINAQGIVLSNGDALTNSVDGDDGQLDGSGRDGRALMSTVYTVNLMDPPTFSSHISMSFDQEQLGFFPTAFGFVWTYGKQNSVVRLDVFDGAGAAVGFAAFGGIGSGIDSDSTDDCFFGVVSGAGIGSVLITTSYPGDADIFEIDHVQFGLFVPEPHATLLLFSVVNTILSRCRFSRGVFNCKPHRIIL